MSTRPGVQHRVRLGQERDITRVEAVVNWAYRGQLPEADACVDTVTGSGYNPVGATPKGKQGQWTTEAHLLGGPRVTRDELQRLLGLDPETKAALFVVEERVATRAAGRDGDEADGRPWAVVGCVLVEKEDDGGHLGMFSVHPHRQGRGLGRLLLDAGEAHIADVFGCRTVLLHVLGQRTDLLAFYQRRGYTLLPREAHPFLGVPPHLGQSLVAPDQEPLHFRILTKTTTTAGRHATLASA